MAEESAENRLVADILTVLKQLVQYGYYDDADDVNEILVPLTKVLDGFRDKPFTTNSKKTLGKCHYVTSCHVVMSLAVMSLCH